MRAFAILPLVVAASGLDWKCLPSKNMTEEVVGEIMDAKKLVVAAVNSCEAHGLATCTIDIVTAIESAKSVVDVFLKVLHNCEVINTASYECGVAATTLSFKATDLGGVFDSIGEACSDAPAAADKPVNCAVNITSTMESIDEAIKGFVSLTDQCKAGETKACFDNTLSVISAFAGIGEYLAMIIGRCTQAGITGAMNVVTNCARESIMITDTLAGISEAGHNLTDSCRKDYARLYSTDLIQTTSNTYGAGSNFAISANFVLVALLPITAIVSFVGGRSYARHSNEHGSRDMEIASE